MSELLPKIWTVTEDPHHVQWITPCFQFFLVYQSKISLLKNSTQCSTSQPGVQIDFAITREQQPTECLGVCPPALVDCPHGIHKDSTRFATWAFLRKVYTRAAFEGQYRIACHGFPLNVDADLRACGRVHAHRVYG